MNVLYFTLDDFDSLINYRSINTDLLREFQGHGHKVYIISPSERKKGFTTRIINENDAVILKPRIGNIQKTNIVEKGISTVTVGTILIKTIDEYFGNIKFDLIIYCTPPITFLSAIEHVKKRDNARTYLLLKDIFPQNAVDIGLISTTGLKGLIYKHFRTQEKNLYSISDRIGCMSPANVKYVLEHNPEIKERDMESRKCINRPIVEVCPNAIEIIDKSVDEETRRRIREQYDIPLNKVVFIYGGNLGKPQGIPFMIECLRKCNELPTAFFLIIGDGTEAHVIEEYVNNEKPQNVRYLSRLPKEDYDNMVGACDVGLIFLDHRFTIPNFPSRMLSYMAAKLPVLACTDKNSDVGKIIADGGFGWWCESNDINAFYHNIETITMCSVEKEQQKSWEYLVANYSASNAYDIITGD